MNSNRMNWMLKVGLALLLPLAIEQGAVLLRQHDAAPKNVFYGVTVVGAAAMVVGVKMASPVLATGLFYGGIITIIKNYHDNWHNLDENVKFFTLLLALILLLFLALRGRAAAGALAIIAAQLLEKQGLVDLANNLEFLL